MQALARIVVFDQMAKIHQECCRLDTDSRRFKVVLTVHDEVVVIVPEDQGQYMLDYMTKTMSVPPKWALTLPVACEGDFALNYGECK